MNSLQNLQSHIGFKLYWISKIMVATKISRNKIKDFSAKLSIMPGLLFSLNRDFSCDDKLLQIAHSNLKKYYCCSDSSDWLDISKSYLKIFHPGGILRKLLE